MYQSGVITEGCGNVLDHGIVAVGYGEHPDTGDFGIIVKNSWGARWGEKGYGWVAPDQCGITDDFSWIEQFV